MDYEKRMQKCHTLITEESVKAALKGDKGSEAHLTSWRTEDFTKKGDNYAAMVTSVKVDFTLDGKEEHVSYIVKMNPCHGFQQFEEITSNVFAKEAEFYLKLLPKLNSVLKETGLKPLAMAHGYHGSLEEGKQLVFLEDLRPRGFKMFDRRKGLDSAHASLVIKELANLHAASLLLQKKEPEYHKDTLLHRGWFNLADNPGESTQMLDMAIKMAIDMLTKIGGYESTITWLGRTKGQLNELFEKQMEPCKYQVLCHGDAWNNNLLFRYDKEGSPVEAMLVDLQVCRRESFAIDLNYLLYTSLTGAVRKPNLDSFLEVYRRQFNSVMEAGGGELLLEQKEVVDEFRHKNIFGVIFSAMVMGALLFEPEDTPDFQSSGEGNDFQNLVEEYHEVMMELLDKNPLLRPRFLAVFDEMLEVGLIPK